MGVRDAAFRRIASIFSALLIIAMTGSGNASAQSLTIALNHEPSTLDQTSTRDGPSGRPIVENILETLWGLDPNGALTPTLASWTVSPDGRTIEFKLRPGVKFHSGDLLAAQDVVFSHERSMQNAPQYSRRGRLLDRVEAVDEQTVRFVFKEPDAGFLPARQLFIVSKAYYDRVGERTFVDHPNGTGPYRFVDYKRGQWLDVEAFPEYWGGLPQVQKARFLIVKDDTTRIAKLRAGEADLIMNTPYAGVASVRAVGFKTVDVTVHPTMSVQFTFANPKAPWADHRVRLAMAHAIDGDAIVNGLLQGIPKRYARLAPGALGFDPELRTYAYDPKLARKLLADAGYPNGLRFPMTYWAGTYQGGREMAEAVALYFKAVGIDVSLQGLDSGQIIELVRKSRTDESVNQIFISAMPMAGLDPTEAFAAYYSGSAFSVYKNAQFDQQYELMSNELNDAKRGDYIKAGARILHEDVATIPIWTAVSVYAMKPNIDYLPTQRTFPLMLLKNVRIQ